MLSAMPTKAAFLLAYLACAPLAAYAAEEEAAERRGWEVGVRYWRSSGEAKWSHNSQIADPSVGNPTSILDYDGIDANVLELHARKAFPNDLFVKGNVGLGSVRKGTFDDQDFAAGQVKTQETVSPVKGKRLRYLTLDAGHDFWVAEDRGSALGFFAGFHYWVERLDAYGATFLLPAGATGVSEGVAVVSNETTWKSLRVGLAGRTKLGGKTRILADLAYVPRSDMKTEDSHYLRTDLGPTPNIRLEGRGKGWLFDLELRHAIFEDVELGIGYRYWRLRSTDGTLSATGAALPLVEFESRRNGLMFSVTKSW
jgi:hypothetical protein